MPRYQKGYAGKLIVQDWSVLDTYSDENSLRYITPRQMAALVSLAEFLGWKTRYANPPEQDTLDAFTAETRYNLMTEISFCALVIGCITDDDDVRNALNQWFVDQINDTSSDVYNAVQQVYNQNVGGQPMPPSVYGMPLYDTDCNLDVLFGALVYMLGRMEQNNVDLQELAEEFSNALERADTLISAIPVFETLPVDEVIGYAQGLMTDDLFEAYNAAITEEYMEDIECDLFCIAQENGCTLTVDLMFHYFYGRILGDPTQELAQLMIYLATGVWTGTEVADVFFSLQLIAMKYGNQFMGVIGIKSVVGYMGIGAHMPDETWVEICDECPTCGITGEIVIGSEGMDGDIITADTALVDRLDITGAAYGRRVEYEFIGLVASITVGWNTDGALDDMFLKLGDNETITLPAPSGSDTFFFDVPDTTLLVDLGYSGSAGAYSTNLARIHIVDACG